MSNSFVKEERYLVLKIKDMKEEEVAELRTKHINSIVEGVVVESDWEPEYTKVWEMIRARWEETNG